ncbi:MAG: glycosyltransferase, partial [Chloroflexia bacterium]|nr:glycosyltransferase [Chloroflexia bacterium]
MRILGVPAFRNRATNPYTALLYGAMTTDGATVDDASPRTLFGPRPDIVHIHWPEYLFSAPSLARAALHAVVFVAVLSWLRAGRASVVWTVHNLESHDVHHRRLEGAMWGWFVRRVDGVISLSGSGPEAALARFPALADRPGFVIPHGHYREAYPDQIDRDTAREGLSLPRDAA